MNGWKDDLQFYILLNSISVISGRWADDNEKSKFFPLRVDPVL